MHTRNTHHALQPLEAPHHHRPMRPRTCIRHVQVVPSLLGRELGALLVLLDPVAERARLALELAAFVVGRHPVEDRGFGGVGVGVVVGCLDGLGGVVSWSDLELSRDEDIEDRERMDMSNSTHHDPQISLPRSVKMSRNSPHSTQHPIHKSPLQSTQPNQ